MASVVRKEDGQALAGTVSSFSFTSVRSESGAVSVRLTNRSAALAVSGKENASSAAGGSHNASLSGQATNHHKKKTPKPPVTLPGKKVQSASSNGVSKKQKLTQPQLPFHSISRKMRDDAREEEEQP